MSVDGVDARKIIGAEVEPMDEFVRLMLETTDGTEFIVRLPAQEIETAIPKEHTSLQDLRLHRPGAEHREGCCEP